MLMSEAPSANPVKLSGIVVPAPTVVAVPSVGVTVVRVPLELNVMVPVIAVEVPEVKSDAGRDAE
jgi:hypothetical protein